MSENIENFDIVELPDLPKTEDDSDLYVVASQEKSGVNKAVTYPISNKVGRDYFDTQMGKKANQSDLNSIQGSVNNLSANKADKSEIVSLDSQIESVQEDIQDLQSNKADKEDVQNAISGTNLLGDKANITAIKAITNPDKGDTYRATDTGFYWKYNAVIDGSNPYDPNNWINIGAILPSDPVLNTTNMGLSTNNNKNQGRIILAYSSAYIKNGDDVRALINIEWSADKWYLDPLGNEVNIPDTELVIRFTKTYIPVIPSKKYKYIGRLVSQASIVIYDANKKVITGFNGSLTEMEFTTPENAAYVRYTVNSYMTTSDGLLYMDEDFDKSGSALNQSIIAKNEADLISSDLYRFEKDLTDTIVWTPGAAYVNGLYEAYAPYSYTIDRYPVDPLGMYYYRGEIFYQITLNILDADGNIIQLIRPDSGSSSSDYQYEKLIMMPANAAFIQLSCRTSKLNTFMFGKVGSNSIFDIRDKIGKLDRLVNEPSMILPDVIHAVTNVEKSIYIDNILEPNPDYRIIVTSSFGTKTPKRFYFTNTAGGDQTVNFKLVRLSDGVIIQNKSVIIRTLTNSVSEAKTVVCLGDSTFDGINMAYWFKEALKAKLTPESIIPTFCGTRGGLDGRGNKPEYHEATWGATSSKFTGLNTGNPFYNPDTNAIDIAYYRNKAMYVDGNGAIQTGVAKIDMVNINLGINDTQQEGTQTSFSTPNNVEVVINAFRADNPDCKFIVNIIFLPALDSVYPMQITRVYNMLRHRQAIIDKFANMENVIIGDIGLCIDRVFGYNPSLESASSFYPDQIHQDYIYGDDIHQTENGGQEVAANSIGTIIKSLR